MNPIAAHRDELKKILENSSGAVTVNKWKTNMEPTSTQKCALYYAQHKTSKLRAELFKKFRAAPNKQARDVRQLTFRNLFIVPQLRRPMVGKPLH